VTPPPVVRLADGWASPLVWRPGRRATILIPAALLARLSHAETTAILAHELTHLHRRDDRFRWLELAIVSAYWWCPFAWLARRRLHEAEERCCDAETLAAFPQIAAHYAGALWTTLNFVAPAPRRPLAALAFVHRNALVRRFEMLAQPQRPAPPSSRVRALLALVVLGLLVTSPLALSADDVAADAPGSVQPVTVRFADGTTIEGEATIIAGRRIFVVERGAATAAEADALAHHFAAAESAPMDPSATSMADAIDSLAMWDLSLGKCLEIALEHDPLVTLSVAADGALVLAPKRGDVSVADVRSAVQNRVRDVVDAYWELWFSYRHLDATKVGRDRALATWRGVKTLARAGVGGGEANAEALARSQYYLFRSQVETGLTNLFPVESRLRQLLGLAASDGRLIRPQVAPAAAHRAFDWNAIKEQALLSRVELTRQRDVVKRLEADLAMAEALDASAAAGYERHTRLRLKREQAVLENIELEVTHQLADAVRDVDLNFDLSQTNLNRRAAADDEVAAVEDLFKTGRIAVDRVLDAQSRSAEAQSAYHRSLADYNRGMMRLEYRTGTLLENRHIELRTPQE
jgi:hypothetical protein